MNTMNKYLISEAKPVEFDENEIKLLNKAFERNNEGDLTTPTEYSLADDGSSGMDEQLYVDISKTNQGFVVTSTLSEDGDQSDGHIKFKDRNIKSVIKKIQRQM